MNHITFYKKLQALASEMSDTKVIGFVLNAEVLEEF